MSSSEHFRTAFSPAQARPASGPEASFAVITHADPTALPRVLELFALRDLVPSEVRVSRRPGAETGAVDGDALEIEVRVAGLDEAATGVVARKLGAMVCVQSAFGRFDKGEQALAVT